MILTNLTNVKNFVINGFPGLQPQYYGPVSFVLLLVFLTIVIGNAFVSVLIVCEQSLHKPSYVIFFHLAMSDLAFGTVTLPKIIARYWWNDVVISFEACFAQMYFVHSLGAIHSLLLFMMALDRFVAVWFPFKYVTIFTNRSATIACTMCWVLTFLRMTVIAFNASTLSYSGENIIRQCYCDHISIIRLASGDRVSYVGQTALANAMVSLLVPLTCIICSYASIFLAVLRMAQVERRHKVLSTCAPQLFITGIYYVPRVFNYLAKSLGINFSLLPRIIIVMMYSLIPAAVNPAIYCLKTADIKHVLVQKLKRRKMNNSISISM